MIVDSCPNNTYHGVMGSLIVFDAALDAQLDADQPWRTMAELSARAARGESRTAIYQLLKGDTCGLRSTRRLTRPCHPVTGLPYGRARYEYAEWRFRAALGWSPYDTTVTRHLARLAQCTSAEVNHDIRNRTLGAGLAPDGSILFLSEPVALRWAARHRAKAGRRPLVLPRPSAQESEDEVP